MDKQKLIKAILKSDLTAKQKIYLEELVNYKSGHWNHDVSRPGYSTCSVCGKYNFAYIAPFCPWCGAKMENYE